MCKIKFLKIDNSLGEIGKKFYLVLMGIVFCLVPDKLS